MGVVCCGFCDPEVAQEVDTGQAAEQEAGGEGGGNQGAPSAPRVGSFHTQPRTISLAAIPGAQQAGARHESFSTLVPDRASFRTLVPDRGSFGTLVPDRRSFQSLAAGESVAPSRKSFDTQLQPNRNSFGTLVPDRGSFQLEEEGDSDDGEEKAKEQRAQQLYADSLEAQAQAQQRAPAQAATAQGPAAAARGVLGRFSKSLRSSAPYRGA
eukprot:TRINITY_DN17670_c0_g1_i1.p1 TRINITY_DN17670_c0_g1~~TRINITY_DN17670_c0_g1_i1.p1  ORF type:complete len:222 (+),score=41.32 TRINITY_DN17670_c0_g1_i1:34-666(+)